MGESHHRRSIRLKEYDYSQPGGYYVTICTFKKEWFFGNVVDRKIRLSPIGKIAYRCWSEIPNHFPNVRLDVFVIMPNHMHGVLMWFDERGEMKRNILKNGSRRVLINQSNRNDHGKTDTGGGVQLNTDVNDKTNGRRGVQLNAPTLISPSTNTLSVIIRTYKAAVTTLCHQNGYVFFRWLRNYYEHVIRNENDLNRIREYILNNPRNWLRKTEQNNDPGL